MSREPEHIFKEKLKVAIIGRNESFCVCMEEFIDELFVSGNSFLEKVGNVRYYKEKGVFYLVINEERTLVFSLHNLSGENYLDKINSYDFLIPVFSLREYSLQEYNALSAEADRVILEIKKKKFLFCFFDAAYVLEARPDSETAWQQTHNELLRFVINPETTATLELPEHGEEILRSLSKVFMYRSRREAKFKVTSRINFFHIRDENYGVIYGQNEFSANFLLQLLKLDKMNTYHFLVN